MKPYQSCGPHWTYGWLRRPEMDSHDEGYCYEAPDGTFVFSLQEDHMQVMFLFEVYEDGGNSYLCDRKGLHC
jgi:hypothetical protein